MRDEPLPRGIRIQQIPDIPLYLIPKTIADVIRGKHASLCRITVRKMFRNRYMLTIETRKRAYRRFAQHKERAPHPVEEEGFFMDMNAGR